MVTWYCDSSALVKRYVREAGSRWFRERQNQNKLLTSALAMAEIAAALSRRRRDGTISLFEFHRDRGQLAHHVRSGQYIFLAAGLNVIEKAARLTYRMPMTAYDAIHLATALIYVRSASDSDVEQFQFITADDQLRRAAEAEGLQTQNPNAYS